MRKIVLASSVIPSGVMWLINCFLEMNIRVELWGHNRETWIKEKDNTYSLNPKFDFMQKWLPTLAHKKVFPFRDDIEVDFTHGFPDHLNCDKIIYFIRDPRDGIYSLFKRERSAFDNSFSFQDFFYGYLPYELLNGIDYWLWHSLIWIKQKNAFYVRFEDYKHDALKCLKSVFANAGIEANEADFIHAVHQSSFEKASKAERNYDSDIIEKAQKNETGRINRSSQVEQWKNFSNEEKWVIDEITLKSRKVLEYLGYDTLHSESKDLIRYDELNTLFIYCDITDRNEVYEKLLSEKEYIAKTIYHCISTIMQNKSLFDLWYGSEKAGHFYVIISNFLKIHGTAVNAVFPKNIQDRLINDLAGMAYSSLTNSDLISNELKRYFKEAEGTDNNVILFAAGQGGNSIYNLINWLNYIGKTNITIESFFDNNKWGQKFHGLDVKRPEKSPLRIIVCSNSYYYEAIKEQLLHLGINESQIIPGFAAAL